MARTAALLAGGLMLPGALGVMNAGGVPYTISNPAPEGHFSTEFADESPEFFDVYAEVKTRYSQVYWTRSRTCRCPRTSWIDLRARSWPSRATRLTRS